MGKIIMVAHQKGGVGKSTLAMNLAVCFQDQLNVALVDTDLQGSLLQIKEDLPGLAVVGNDQLVSRWSDERGSNGSPIRRAPRDVLKVGVA